MNSEIVKLKADSKGFHLEFLKPIEFPLVIASIKQKLESGKKFFTRGMTVKFEENLFSKEEILDLTELFTAYGIIIRPVHFEDHLQNLTNTANTNQSLNETLNNLDMTVINHTVRGGQEIVAKGSLLICGNVNPGAHIVAGGNIDIRGTCRGTVHAGAYGDKNVFVIADRLMPVQIRIADVIAQAPEKNEKPSCAEKAFIKNGYIVIEPIER